MMLPLAPVMPMRLYELPLRWRVLRWRLFSRECEPEAAATVGNCWLD